MSEITQIQQKICLLGDFAVGKTSLVRRFVHGLFDDKYLSTVGVNISRKSLDIENIRLNLLLWDLNGGGKFDTMLASYCAGAAGAIIVCDLGRAETLLKAAYYAESFLKLRPKSQLIFVGNKADLLPVDWRISPEQLSELALRHTTLPAFLTSAKNGSQVEELFLRLGHVTVSPQ